MERRSGRLSAGMRQSKVEGLSEVKRWSVYLFQRIANMGTGSDESRSCSMSMAVSDNEAGLMAVDVCGV